MSARPRSRATVASGTRPVMIERLEGRKQRHPEEGRRLRARARASARVCVWARCRALRWSAQHHSVGADTHTQTAESVDGRRTLVAGQIRGGVTALHESLLGEGSRDSSRFGLDGGGRAGTHLGFGGGGGLSALGGFLGVVDVRGSLTSGPRH